ncbi:hypothetical protein ACP4OV_008576 [Aristida adscensionis]
MRDGISDDINPSPVRLSPSGNRGSLPPLCFASVSPCPATHVPVILAKMQHRPSLVVHLTILVGATGSRERPEAAARARSPPSRPRWRRRAWPARQHPPCCEPVVASVELDAAAGGSASLRRVASEMPALHAGLDAGHLPSGSTVAVPSSTSAVGAALAAEKDSAAQPLYDVSGGAADAPPPLPVNIRLPSKDRKAFLALAVLQLIELAAALGFAVYKAYRCLYAKQ